MQIFGLPGQVIRNAKTATRLLDAKTPNIEAPRTAPGQRFKRRQAGSRAMSRLMLKSAKRASLVENLRSLRGLDKMRVR